MAAPRSSQGTPKKRGDRPRERSGGDKRERILTAATHVFARKGFYAARVSEIAREAGVPLVIDGQFVGAIGVSGVTSQQDGQIAGAGAAEFAAQDVGAGHEQHVAVAADEEFEDEGDDGGVAHGAVASSLATRCSRPLRRW